MMGVALSKGLEFMSRNPETPAEEMARLIRVIGGKAAGGEKDEQLRARAARRMGISASRAKVFWYAGTDNIKSDEMDRARELAFVRPIEEAINAVEAAKSYLNRQLARLLDEPEGAASDGPAGASRDRLADASRREVDGNSRSAAGVRVISSRPRVTAH